MSMKKILIATFVMFAPCLPAFGQAFTGPAAISQPTTAGHCVKIATSGGNALVDAGDTCTADAGGVETITAGVGITVDQNTGDVTITNSGVLPTQTLTSAAPTVSSNRVGLGGTVVAPGSGNCPAAVVAGCLVINVAGTLRVVPFY